MKNLDDMNRPNGFTLIELIIVVVIIGIAATIAVPMMSSAGDMQVRSAANRIAADLDYAKSLAITHQTSYSVEFNTANESYEIQDSAGDVITNPVTNMDYVVDFASDSRSNRVNIATVSFNTSLIIREVTFDYLGSPYAGSGTATGLNSGTISLEDDTGTFEIDIEIEPMTGYVTVE